MSQVTVDFPDEMLAALKLSKKAADDEVRLAAAMKLFELGRLSSGAAAQLAGIPRTEFLSRLSEYGVDTFARSEDELRREAENA